MTLNEIIYDIRERLKLNSDDVDMTNEYFAHLINVKRVYLLKQRFSKFTRNIPEEVKQILCLDLETVDSIDGLDCSGKIVRSVQSLPSLLEIGGRSALIGIRTHDIMFPHFNIVPVERLPFIGYNKFLQSQTYVALDADNKLYFKSDKTLHLMLKKIKAVGVFANPEEADLLNCESTEDCEFFDKQYPVEAYLVSDIVNMIIKELAPTLSINDDSQNNAD